MSTTTPHDKKRSRPDDKALEKPVATASTATTGAFHPAAVLFSKGVDVKNSLLTYLTSKYCTIECLQLTACSDPANASLVVLQCMKEHLQNPSELDKIKDVLRKYPVFSTCKDVADKCIAKNSNATGILCIRVAQNFLRDRLMQDAIQHIPLNELNNDSAIVQQNEWEMINGVPIQLLGAKLNQLVCEAHAFRARDEQILKELQSRGDPSSDRQDDKLEDVVKDLTKKLDSARTELLNASNSNDMWKIQIGTIQNDLADLRNSTQKILNALTPEAENTKWEPRCSSWVQIVGSSVEQVRFFWYVQLFSFFCLFCLWSN